jgi:hypothetical protein
LICATGEATGLCNEPTPSGCPEGEICLMSEICIKACEPLA